MEPPQLVPDKKARWNKQINRNLVCQLSRNTSEFVKYVFRTLAFCFSILLSANPPLPFGLYMLMFMRCVIVPYMHVRYLLAYIHIFVFIKFYNWMIFIISHLYLYGHGRSWCAAYGLPLCDIYYKHDQGIYGCTIWYKLAARQCYQYNRIHCFVHLSGQVHGQTIAAFVSASHLLLTWLNPWPLFPRGSVGSNPIMTT